MGGGTIFSEPVLVVNQKARLIEVNNEYAVFDRNGTQVGAVRQVGQSRLKKVVRLVGSWDQFMTHKLQIVDMAGTPLLVLTRPAKVMKSKIVVEDGACRQVGQIVQENVVGKINFGLHDADGRKIGAIKAENWRAWNFSITDETGTEARITKTWEGLVKTFYTTADNFVVHIHRPAGGTPSQPGGGLGPRRRHRSEAGLPRTRLSDAAGDGWHWVWQATRWRAQPEPGAGPGEIFLGASHWDDASTPRLTVLRCEHKFVPDGPSVETHRGEARLAVQRGRTRRGEEYARQDHPGAHRRDSSPAC